MRFSLMFILGALLLSGCNAVPARHETMSTMPTTNATALKMHSSWDANGDGINDCENDGSCDHTVDYSQPRKLSSTTVNANSANTNQPNSQPTFDCQTDGLGSVEKLICNDNTLAQFDQKMDKTFKTALAKIDNAPHKKQFLAMQRVWIKGRNDCWKEADIKACIEASYTLRQAELEARFQLANSSIPVHYTCENNKHNEFIVTYFATQPATAIVDRGDKSELLYRKQATEGVSYSNGNYQFSEHNGTIEIQWGFGTSAITCSVN